MAGHADALASYLKLKDLRLRLNQSLVETLDKPMIQDAARRLGMLQGDTIVFDSEAEASVMFEYAIYFLRKNGRNAVESFVEKTPPAQGSLEMALLQAMLRSHYTLLRIGQAERGVGVEVTDILRGESGFLVDVGISISTRENQVMATRVIPWDDFLMTGGAGVPVTLQAMKMIQKEVDRRFDPATTDFKQITPEQEAEIATIAIRACMAAGTTSRVAYADPSAVLAGRPRAISSSPEHQRSRRNASCPCGSGKKYKACCGRR